MAAWISESITTPPGQSDRLSLADVRPYLYHVGFWSGDWSGIDIKVSDASVVEDRLVRAGRRYLQDEREKGFG